MSTQRTNPKQPKRQFTIVTQVVGNRVYQFTYKYVNNQWRKSHRQLEGYIH